MKKKINSNISDNYTRHLIRGNVTGNLGINSALRFSAVYGEGIDRFQVLRSLQKENTFRFWWYLIFGLLSIACLIYQPASWLSVIEIFVLMVNIDLVSRGHVVGLYLGIVDCVLYIIISSLSGLWGEVIKMGFIYIPLNIVAIINWTKNLKSQKGNKYSKKSIQIKRLDAKGWTICAAALLALGIAGYFFLGWINTTTLILSTITFAFGIVNKYLSSQRYLESYALNIVTNIISTALWTTTFITTLSPTALVPILFKLASLTDGIYGYILWKGMYKSQKVNGGKILSKRKVNIKRVIKLRRMYKNLYWKQSVDIIKNS